MIQVLHVSTSKSSAPPKLWCINHSRRQRPKPCYGAVRRSCRSSKLHRWGSRVQVVPTQKKSQKGYTPTWNLNMIPSTKNEPDGKRIIFLKERPWFGGFMFLFRGCLIEGWSFFPVSSRPSSFVPFCWTNPSCLWAISKTPSGLPKSRGFCYHLLGEPPYGTNKNLVAKLMLFFPLFETDFQKYTYVIMLLTLFFSHVLVCIKPCIPPHVSITSTTFQAALVLASLAMVPERLGAKANSQLRNSLVPASACGSKADL